MLNSQSTRVSSKRIAIGDKVILREDVSNASLNLYMIAKQKGMLYLKCPCNSKKGEIFEVVSSFSSGFILQDPVSKMKIVAHANDLQKITEWKHE